MFTNCPTYTINLDAPPGQRWDHIIPDFRDKIPLATQLADEMLGSTACSMITALGLAQYTGMVAHCEELQGIANGTGMKLGKVLLLQLAYEAFAACTSVIVNGKDHPIHIRTMDWAMPILKKLTIQLEFQRNGKTVFTGTTWAGYIGILTGMKARAFSVSINYRQTHYGITSPKMSFIRNIYRCILGYWPIGYLVRDVLDSDSNYKKAVKKFMAAELISPTYITVCGTRKNQGMVISRNRSPHDNKNGNTQTLLTDGDIVQANADHWKTETNLRNLCTETEWDDICESKYRRQFVLDALTSSKEKFNHKTLKLIMATDPCYSNDITIYTSLMAPAASSFATWIHISYHTKRKGKATFNKISKRCHKLYTNAIAK
jgi:hypothetical protein